MLNKTLNTIKENNLIKNGDKVILGISGGPDSVYLFNILNYLKKELRIKIILAHVNYNYRGKDSKLDKQFIKKIAKTFKTKLYCKNIDPKNYKNKNLEEYFREIRYKFFDQVLKLEKANKIAVAHNKDDQVETILMFLIRGAGLRGLSGMKYKNKKIIRPLLNIEKKDILIYLKENKIKYRIDKTNQDFRFKRNKIRHQLIPYLEKEFNPNVKEVLFNNAKTIQEENNLLEKLTECAFKKITKRINGEFIINLKEFNKFDPALKNRLIIYITKKHFREEISLSLLLEILKTIKKSKNSAKKIIGNLEIVKNYDKITFRKRKKIKNIELTQLKLDSKIELKKLGLKIEIKKVDKIGKLGKNKCYIDLKKTGQKLFIRSRKEGDKFYPIGLRGSQKIKDFFINNKVDPDKRDLVPLVLNNINKIVYVGGYRVDRRFAADKESKNILKIQIDR